MHSDLTKFEKLYATEQFSEKGLITSQAIKNGERFGKNVLTRKGKISVFRRILNALCEPMVLILVFAFFITLGVNIGNYFAGSEVDPFECTGIFLSICISVGLTVIMETKSEKAFDVLKSFTENLSVSVIRDGEKRLIGNADVCVGDVIFIEIF